MTRPIGSPVPPRGRADRSRRIPLLLAWAAITCAGPGLTFAQDASPAKAPTAATGPVAIIDGVETPPPAIKMGDPAVVARIIDEGKNRSQVMRHLEHVTKKIGTRLTGSSNTEKANKWCAEQYKSWGLVNTQIEPWGEIPVRFDRGPSTGQILVEKDGALTPAKDLDFTTYSWSSGTKGAVRGPVVKMPTTEEEYSAVKGRLKGAWIMLSNPEGTGQQRAGVMSVRYQSNVDVRTKVRDKKLDTASLPVDERILFDGINGFISPTRELVITSSVRGWRKLDPSDIPPDVCVAIRKEHYDDIDKRLAAGETFQLEFNLPHTFTPGPIPCYNTIAEIPGTTWPNQVVVVSGHLDSWDGPGSEGCTDNGTGTATTLETARILMAAGAKPKRTIRFINWTGEEQGLLGSAGYVDKHKDELVAGVSACLVDDGGTNYNGGMPAAEQMIPMLAAASAPVNNVFYSETDKKYLNVNIRNTGKKIATHGASDHASFNRIGVPGFFWDETGRADYNHTHHTQYDKLDQAIPEYLVQSATSAAVIAYNLACADELLPRVVPETKPEESAPVASAAPKAPQPEPKAAVVPAKKRARPVLP